jgi:hypothetical protein
LSAARALHANRLATIRDTFEAVQALMIDTHTADGREGGS